MDRAQSRRHSTCFDLKSIAALAYARWYTYVCMKGWVIAAMLVYIGRNIFVKVFYA